MVRMAQNTLDQVSGLFRTLPAEKFPKYSQKWPVLGLFGPESYNLEFLPQNWAYLRIQGPLGQNNVLYTHLDHGFGGDGGMYGSITLKIDGEMKFYRSARSPPLAWPTTRWGGGGSHDSAKFRV